MAQRRTKTGKSDGIFRRGGGVVTADPSSAWGTHWLVLLGGGTLVVAGILAYANSFTGVHVFDDQNSILENPSIRHLWPIGPVLLPPGNALTVSGRPMVNLSLALNYAAGQTRVWGYHATNLAIHVLAALFLFGILRRTLHSVGVTVVAPDGNWATESTLTAGLLAFSIALLWAVHPLQTESVTYIVQRAESLVGLFYFLTLYCVIRGAEVEAGKLPLLWYIGAVLACLLGMASKEVMSTAPLVVLLYDRAFLTGSFREALRRRWGLYACLAASWALLGYLLSTGGLLGHTAEIGSPDPWSYARTQPGVLLYYLRLCVWPHPLCLDYGWPVARSVQEILPPAIVIGGLLAATLWGLVRNRPYSFLGAWFFLILAPTSSIVPLPQSAFEHRLYLSLAAVVTLIVMGGYAVGQTLVRRGLVSTRAAMLVGSCLVVAAAVTLGGLTYQRNEDYQSEVAIWQDTVHKAPHNIRALNGLGCALADQGQLAEAVDQFRRALAIAPNFNSCINLGNALYGQGKVQEAIGQWQDACRLQPQSITGLNQIAWVRATNEDPAIRNGAEAVELAQLAVKNAKNRDVNSLDTLAAAYAEVGRFTEALAVAQQAAGLAQELGDDGLFQRIQQRTALYAAGRPFRE